MGQLSQETASRILFEHGGYTWLIEGKAFWSVSEVVRALTQEGVKISNDTVARWFKTLPHTQDFGGPVGLRASRNDLVQMFALQMSPDTDQTGKDTGEPTTNSPKRGTRAG